MEFHPCHGEMFFIEKDWLRVPQNLDLTIHDAGMCTLHLVLNGCDEKLYEVASAEGCGDALLSDVVEGSGDDSHGFKDTVRVGPRFFPRLVFLFWARSCFAVRLPTRLISAAVG